MTSSTQLLSSWPSTCNRVCSGIVPSALYYEVESEHLLQELQENLGAHCVLVPQAAVLDVRMQSPPTAEEQAVDTKVLKEVAEQNATSINMLGLIDCVKSCETHKD